MLLPLWKSRRSGFKRDCSFLNSGFRTKLGNPDRNMVKDHFAMIELKAKDLFFSGSDMHVTSMDGTKDRLKKVADVASIKFSSFSEEPFLYRALYYDGLQFERKDGTRTRISVRKALETVFNGFHDSPWSMLESDQQVKNSPHPLDALAALGAVVASQGEQKMSLQDFLERFVAEMITTEASWRNGSRLSDHYKDAKIPKVPTLLPPNQHLDEELLKYMSPRGRLRQPPDNQRVDGEIYDEKERLIIVTEQKNFKDGVGSRVVLQIVTGNFQFVLENKSKDVELAVIVTTCMKGFRKQIKNEGKWKLLKVQIDSSGQLYLEECLLKNKSGKIMPVSNAERVLVVVPLSSLADETASSS
mmetsp:Transcript_14095/g.19557  ORF Transcript_14095/g.19557 Transcript_14095/m.19557 type:complete len:358 (+) Transcript_14095:1580-2653(+)